MNYNVLDDSTNQSGHYVTLLERNPALAIPYVTFMAICSVLGTFGNVLIIVSILKIKKLRTLGNAFLMNMAVSDLFVTTLVDMSAITGVIHGRKIFVQHPSLCQVIVSIAMISYAVSIGSIAIVSLHRFTIICFFSQSRKIFTKTSVGGMIAGTWLFGFIYNLRFALKWDNDGYNFDPKVEQCLYDRKANSWLFRIVSSLSLLMVTVSYSGIFCFVRRHREQMRRKSVTKHRENSIILAYTLLLTVVVFYISVIPYGLVRIIDNANLLAQEAYMLTALLVYWGAAVNWIIYGLTNQQFRSAFKLILCPKRN